MRSGWRRCRLHPRLVEVGVFGGAQVDVEEVDAVEKLRLFMAVMDASCDDSACLVGHCIILCACCAPDASELGECATGQERSKLLPN